MRRKLEPVVELDEFVRVAGLVLERSLEKPVGEPGIARKEGPVQVRSNRVGAATALVARLAIVAEAMDDPAEWLGRLVEFGAASVVFEAGDRQWLTIRERALEQHVADQTRRSSRGGEGEDAGSRQDLPAHVAVRASEKLIATADREKRATTFDERDELTVPGGNIVGNQQLIAILASAHIHEVRVLGYPLATPDRADSDVEITPFAPALQDGHVASVGIDVEQLRIHMGNHELHGMKR